MKEKLLQLSRNHVRGIDLITEKDAGNEIRILTGKPERSMNFWKRLRGFCDEAISELTNEIGDNS